MQPKRLVYFFIITYKESYQVCTKEFCLVTETLNS